jgi:hypothetical protein
MASNTQTQDDFNVDDMTEVSHRARRRKTVTGKRKAKPAPARRSAAVRGAAKRSRSAAERVTVRALIERGARKLDRADVFFGHLNEQVFVAGVPGRVAGALFILAEHCPVQPGGIENRCHTLSDLLRPRIECHGATDPKEHFRIRLIGQCRHCEG